jgi:hypothetical protein
VFSLIDQILSTVKLAVDYRSFRNYLSNWCVLCRSTLDTLDTAITDSTYAGFTDSEREGYRTRTSLTDVVETLL